MQDQPNYKNADVGCCSTCEYVYLDRCMYRCGYGVGKKTKSFFGTSLPPVNSYGVCDNYLRDKVYGSEFNRGF